ncbi:glycosyltransferase [Pseudarthrobacter sp. AB1]|uniref:glycosyltransferase n=1 Tax=Pseudarthrobacter sp. AB1 TaxID=2138309 RepID=UPI00186B6366|nr:glycosyltransferase [Pseudarthrobacter sp. AB1]MBE4719485.1 glycosyl transferase [Pseudarthrobacter sp. AB1]
MQKAALMIKARQLFEVVDDGGSGLLGGEGRLSDRELGLLAGAMNYHSLVHPGREFKVIVLRAPAGEFPRLTGYECHRHEWKPDRTVVCTVDVRSTVAQTIIGDSALLPLVIDLGGERSEGGKTFYDRPGRKAKVLSIARFGAPIAFDVLRQGLTDYYEKRVVPKRRTPRMAPFESTPTSRPSSEQNEQAIIFGLHWLEMGGAERWAIESIALAREAGFLPIVLTDRESAHPWIARPELDGALVLPMNLPISDKEESDLLLALFLKFSIRGIHVHHNDWLYHCLPWFKAMDHRIKIVDSLHVIEWRTGGFVEVAVKLSNAIDVHHVISPQLRDYMVLQRDVPKERVALAPLYGLNDVEMNAKVKPVRAEPFTVSFVGRLSQQKRPYLFLRYAAQLRRSTDQEVRFILHGSGALIDEVNRLVARYGLSDCLELRRPPRSVDDTLAESDLLVISSDNEGLTLTTFEATAHNVAVLSTDVGSQASLVAGRALVPRQPLAFIREAVMCTKAIMESEELREQIVEEQRQKIAALKELPEAREWTKELYEGWKV